MPSSAATPATQVYGGVSAAERRAERRAKLMAAALELLGTEGMGRYPVRAVCIQARLTPRFFYESFPDLDALAVAVFDDVVEDTTSHVLVAVADAVRDAPEDRRAQARAAIGTVVSDLTDDPRRARIVFVEALGNEALARRRAGGDADPRPAHRHARSRLVRLDAGGQGLSRSPHPCWPEGWRNC